MKPIPVGTPMGAKLAELIDQRVMIKLQDGSGPDLELLGKLRMTPVMEAAPFLTVEVTAENGYCAEIRFRAHDVVAITSKNVINLRRTE